MPDVICLGEILIDFVALKDNVALKDMPGYIGAPGGAPANVAVAVQRLGLDAAFVGKIGDDPNGVFIREALDDAGINTDFLCVDPDARTTIVFVAVWDDGRKDLCFYRNPGADMRLLPEEITPELFDGARVFHYGSIAFIGGSIADAQRKALDMARARNLMISYDPNYRPTLWPDEATARTVIQDSFKYCHLAKIAEEEWSVATGHEDLDAGIQAVLDRGVEVLIISRGANGALVTNGDYRLEITGRRDIEVVETLGAGDAFMGAMITRLLPEFERLGSLRAIDKETMQVALTFANTVGALACTKPGAIPALPTRAEVEAFIDQQG